MTAQTDQLGKLLGMLGSNFDGEVLVAARKAHALLVANDWTWPELLANGSAAALTQEHIARIFAAGMQKGEALGYQRGLADAQSGAVKGPQAEIENDLDWAQRVLEAAETGKACLREADVDFANDMLAKTRRWGKSTFVSQKQHNYIRIIETKLQRYGFL